MLIIEIEKRPNKMVDRIRYPTVSYLPFYYVFFQFLLLTIFNLQANILTTKDILSNLAAKLFDCNLFCQSAASRAWCLVRRVASSTAPPRRSASGPGRRRFVASVSSGSAPTTAAGGRCSTAAGWPRRGTAWTSELPHCNLFRL